LLEGIFIAKKPKKNEKKDNNTSVDRKFNLSKKL
jgi:hypothetical protein